MHLRKFITIAFFILIVLGARAQSIERFNCFSYSVNEGLLQTTMSNMAFDRNNYCWLSFPNGVQKFDGQHFTRVPVQPGLPDDKETFLFNSSGGDLFISHTQGISRYDVDADRFTLFFTNRPGETAPALFVGEDEGNMYIYTESGTIACINLQTLKVTKEAKAGFPAFTNNDSYRPRMLRDIINHRTIFRVNSMLCLWDLQQGKMIATAEFLPAATGFLMMKNEDEVLYYNYTGSADLWTYNFRTKQSSISVKRENSANLGQRGITTFRWQNKRLIYMGNRLYETDTALRVLRSELVNFQNQPILGNVSVGNAREDRFGNLYIGTVTTGIRKIARNNYPIKYYGTPENKDNFIISILPDKGQNRILAGTAGNGLLVFDTLQQLVKHIRLLPGQNTPFSVSTFLKDNKGNYLLFNWSDKKVWRLSNDLSRLESIPVQFQTAKKTIGYYGNVVSQNENGAIVQSDGKLYRVDFAANTIYEHEATNSYTMSATRYNNTIITHGNGQLIFIDAATFREVKRIPFKNTGLVRCFAPYAGDIYVGTNKGIFRIDSTGKVLWHLKKEDGLPDECIYGIAIDNNGFLWCSTNKGILRINKDNSFLQLKKEDGLQENEFNTNVVARTPDGELFFGGVNGLSSFYPSAINNTTENIKVLFTNIRVNNKGWDAGTAIWNTEKMDLSYNQNSLAFDFIAMAGNNPGQYTYQYKMEGVDEEWIQNDEMQTVRYYLQPGKYTFKVYASRFFDKDAKAIKEIRIIINPPFWKTWWFITAMIILALALLAYALNRYNKNKYQKKLAELESEHKIKEERENISRNLHDSIGAYANAVLYKTELLQKEDIPDRRDELMNDLKFASKDIITSLRETIWALKKEAYTAEECLLRIKNFIQPLTGYYTHIHFKVEGNAPSGKTLHHIKALNLVRMVQEAVTNAIKHSGATHIRISNESSKGRWQLCITDDGKGFDLKTTEPGNGLDNMKKRALDSEFELTIQTHPETGTTICILT